jgi:plasmid stabilization system protein ParE
MSLPAVFHDAAGVEVDDAADYYDLESPGLGTAFIDEVARVIAKLEEHPKSAAPLHGNVRKAPLAKFPYSLLYSVKKDCIRILAVAHQRRRPFYWRGRS